MSVTAPSAVSDWPARARDRFPDGSNGEFGWPEEQAPVVDRGLGCRVFDTTGRELLDFSMAWGSALVGHAHPKVIEAAARQAELGVNFAAVNRRSVELAERLQEINPALERLRFVTSGTEATMMCLRVARAATGKPAIMKFAGAYHGQHPEGIAAMLTPDASFAAAAPWVNDHVVVAPFNDADAVDRLIGQHADRLAAVIVEPLHRCITPREDFLGRLRAATARRGVPLIFDEVVTGFRLAHGGAREYYGVTPDLFAYGKALGGGYPIGVYGGRRDLMDVVSECDLANRPNYAWSASTTGGNPVCSAAALAVLDGLSEDGVYEHLHDLGKRLRAGMRDALASLSVSAQVLGDGPLAQIAFSNRPVIDQTTQLKADGALGRRLMLTLASKGVFLNPMGTKLYLSIAHGTPDVDRFLVLLEESLRLIFSPATPVNS